ncbi:MAG TPA: hypothetical protein VFV67_27675 [Actinophytocola sp.]|uniref:hypothetical protein n=1 Tax=Actinophytocola sp. TaxID=1872138 RepID=UPI002DB61B47|nr:hypothetical protein [Actinophytocola sp.]HEU5474445.1 hypothetical protein [Actinophytocola sp.]
MSTMLPAPRDLPPHRHARIRAELLRTTAAPARPARRWLAPMATATVLIGVAAVVWALPRPDGRLSPAAGTPPATTPVSTTPSGAVLPEVPGHDRNAIEQGCASAVAGPGGPPTPGATADSFRLVNVLSDQAGPLALLYADDVAMACVIDGPGLPYNPSFGGPGVRMPGEPVVIDLNGASAGGDIAGGKPGSRGRPGTEILAGRYDAPVTRITLTKDRITVAAVLANGTFVGRIVHPTDWLIPAGNPSPTLHAYDANGTLLMTAGG